MTEPVKSFIETKYKSVPAYTVDTSGGFQIPNGEHHSIYRFRANGADHQCFVSLIWDYQGENEKIICSTKGDIDIFFDVSSQSEHLTGDGSKYLKIVIFNNTDSASPIVGGSFEMVEVD